MSSYQHKRHEKQDNKQSNLRSPVARMKTQKSVESDRWLSLLTLDCSVFVFFVTIQWNHLPVAKCCGGYFHLCPLLGAPWCYYHQRFMIHFLVIFSSSVLSPILMLVETLTTLWVALLREAPRRGGSIGMGSQLSGGGKGKRVLV